MSTPPPSSAIQNASTLNMLRLLFPLILLLLLLAGDFSIYRQLASLLSNPTSLNIFQWSYWGLNAALIIGLFYAIFAIQRNGGKRTPSTNFIMGFAFSVLVCKLLILPFILLNILTVSLIGMPLFLYIGVGLIGIVFLAMIHGITLGKYNYEVNKEILYFEDLPDAFDGFTLAQISDIHSGSFDSEKAVEKGVKMVNAQNPDLIVFTGDLVNHSADEIIPFQKVFQKLKANFGVYSVVGNHDYYQLNGAGVPINSRIPFFKKQHENTGFELLANEHVFLEKGNERIALCGVENWGEPPFPQIGDLNHTLTGTQPQDFRILLSHDPSHWKAQVLPHESKVHLTLSGHTHAMQFGINLLGIRWSPVQYRYKQWMGLYEQANQYLYVNRGFGFLGFPGRVGMFPEISVFELRKKG